jgi:hypothetical protein
MKVRLALAAGAAGAAALALAPAWGASSPHLTLHPSGFGDHAYAAWKAGQGEKDDRGAADEALYFQKATSTATYSAAVAVVQGIAGTPADELQGLEWQHRDDGHCGAGAPRWNVTVQNNGVQRTVFLGCAAAAHSPGDETGWTRDTYDGPALTGQFLPGDVITGLAIVFDEGNDVGQGFVYLDNVKIDVNGVEQVFTYAGDNGNQ